MCTPERSMSRHSARLLKHCSHLSPLPCAQTIQFDGFKVWEGSCPPKAGLYDDIVDPVRPRWPGMRINTAAKSTLAASFHLDNLYTGNGCAAVLIRNEGKRDCRDWVVEIEARPSWGSVSKYTGLTLVASDKLAGACMRPRLHCAPRPPSRRIGSSSAHLSPPSTLDPSALDPPSLPSQIPSTPTFHALTLATPQPFPSRP